MWDIKEVFGFGDEEEMLNYLEKKSSRTFQYRLEFLLRVLKELRISTHRVIVKFKGQEHKEENSTEKTIELIRNLKPNKVDVTIEVGKDKCSFEVRIDLEDPNDVFALVKEYGVMMEIAAKSNRKGKFKKLFKRTVYPEVSEFANLVPIIAESMKNQASSENEHRDLIKDVIQRIFVLINIVTMKFEGFYTNNNLDATPDEYIEDKTKITENVEETLEYTSWFIEHSFKNCYLSGKELVMSIIARKAVLNAFLIVLMVYLFSKLFDLDQSSETQEETK